MGEHVCQPCTCPHGERALGRLHGVSMGQGVVRLSTTPGCPEHDACHGWTATKRAAQPAWSRPWCPIHGTRNCPPGPAATREPPSFAEIAQAGEEWVHQGGPAATRDGEGGDRD